MRLYKPSFSRLYLVRTYSLTKIVSKSVSFCIDSISFSNESILLAISPASDYDLKRVDTVLLPALTSCRSLCVDIFFFSSSLIYFSQSFLVFTENITA